MTRAKSIQTCIRCGRPLPDRSELPVCTPCALEDALRIADVTAPLPSSAGPPSAASGQSLGKLGDYELVEILGRGGMGTVYKARRQGAEGWVAVKVLAGGIFADKKAHERLQREAQALARLHHPDIVQIHEVGDADGLPFLVMSFVDGPNLAQLVRDHPLEPRRAARIVAQVADAVQNAHEQGILHRDLKPSNILLDAEERPKITDFGLAVADWMPRDLTRTGETLGSPAYLPPEQISAHRGEVKQASDIYAIGAVLYQLLTGRPPFSAATPADTIEQVLRREVPALSLLNPAVPVELEAVCLRCLDKKPERRYRSAGMVAEALRAFANRSQPRARSQWLQSVWWRVKRAHPAQVVAMLFLLAVSLLGLGAVIGLYAWNHQMRDDLVRTQELAGREQRMRHTAELQHERLAYAHQIVAAQRSREAGDTTAARRNLSTTDVAQRGWEHRYLQGMLDQHHLRLQGHGNPISAVAFHPTGNQVASLGMDLTLRVWSMPDGRQSRQVVAHRERPLSLAFSRDGTSIVTGGQDGTVRIWNGESLKEERQFSLNQGRATAVNLDRSATRVVAGDSLGRFHLWDRVSGTLLITGQADSAELFSAVFSPDGTTLATGGRDRKIRLWSVPEGKPLQTIAGHRGAVRALKFSPDGALLTSGSDDGTVALWRAGDGVQLFSLAAHQDLVLALDYSRDGSVLASGGADGMICLWNPVAGKLDRVLHGHSGRVNSVALSPDGEWLASGGIDQEVFLWRTRHSPLVRVFDGHTNVVTRLEFSSNNRNLLSAARDGTARVWSLDTGQVRNVFNAHNSRITMASFSPNGETVVTSGADGRCVVWNLKSGLQERTFDPGQGPARSLAIAPDGKRVASSHDAGGVCVWDLETASPLLKFSSKVPRINRVQFSSDGTMAYTAGAAAAVIEVWNSVTGERVKDLQLPQGSQTCMVLKPDTQRIAYGTANGRIMVIEAGSGKLVWSAHGHSAAVSQVAWSPDGERLASCGRDGSLRVWDAFFGYELLLIRGLFSEGFALAWSRDGTYLAVSGRSGRIWLLGSTGERLVQAGAE